ncbi:hypothetical protein BKA66DRAFT_565579 [Pyrenochaeta sp. MPI-SDFR-AT-0127]|nr:hypothetical protein BKA66DRAFT_565579 [Pyrenochaeta sp. MPI-SDFR-AT-0127]
MQGIRYCYSALYRAFTDTPELAKFHRYLDYWSWILYNQSADIEKQADECIGLIAEIHGVPRERSPFTVIDYHRAYVQDEHPFLKVKIDNIEKSVRRYSKDLLIAHAIANLPDQCDVYARNFAKQDDVFDNGIFGPTKEDAGMYRQVPPHAGMCSFKGIDPQDPVTNLVLRYLEPLNVRIKGLVRCIVGRREPRAVTSQSNVTFNTILTVMNLLAGIFGTLLFAGCMGVLSCIDSEKWRIVVLGAFGLVLITSLVLFVPTLKRNDIFAVIAAFFAVGGVYIGAKGIDKR